MQMVHDFINMGCCREQILHKSPFWSGSTAQLPKFPSSPAIEAFWSWN